MSIYSVAEAQAELADLIDQAVAGDKVIITRHGLPVAEIRPTGLPSPETKAAALERLLSHRFIPPPGTPTSVELLNMIYDESNA